MMSFRTCFCMAIVLAGLTFPAASSATPDEAQYLVTNDDVPPPIPANMATVYTVGANGTLTMDMGIIAQGFGAGGGYFPASRIVMLNNGSNQCIFLSEALNGDIVGIPISNLQTFTKTYGSESDTGASNGIGLAMNNQYLYASFTDDSTIGTFEVQGNCSLTFVSDTPVAGLNGGIIDAIHVLGNIMVASYGDGSIQSFDISNGPPVSNGDEQNSTGSKGGESYPSSIDITQDGHYAIFGDTSMTTLVEVSDISSGKLSPTVVYYPGTSINSSNIMLSPDETLLYISNTEGDTITAAFFNKTSGTLSSGCTSGNLKGYVSGWSYISGLALQGTTGTGGVVYAAEFPSSIAVVNVTSSGGTCTLTESASSPVSDPDSPGLLSIGTFPPRPF